MRSFLRDLAFLGLFAAAVAAVVLVVAVHQGSFSLPTATPAPEDAPPAALARVEALETPPEPARRAALAHPAPPVAAPPPARPAPGAAFDPGTEGVLGDARVICLPEVAWLQEQLSHWAAEGARLHPEPPDSLAAAHRAARRASAYEYRVSPECWNDPGTLETRGWGDCADKSLWLARALLRSGYTMVGIRLGVPEDYQPGRPGHAWVVLYHHGGEWIYDPASSPRLTSQDAGLAKRFRVTATVFPRLP